MRLWKFHRGCLGFQGQEFDFITDSPSNAVGTLRQSYFNTVFLWNGTNCAKPYWKDWETPRAENLLTLEKIDPRKATYFQNLWYFLSGKSSSENSRKFGLFFKSRPRSRPWVKSENLVKPRKFLNISFLQRAKVYFWHMVKFHLETA